MQRVGLAARFILVLAVLPLALGCGANRSQPAADKLLEGDRAAEGQNVTELSDVFAAWKSGDEDRAAELLLSIEWNEPDLTSPVAALEMPEERFMSLPQSERSQISEEALHFAQTSRALARHAISLGEKAVASGDTERAEAYFNAVHQFGQTPSDSQRLMVLLMVGNSIVTMADK